MTLTTEERTRFIDFLKTQALAMQQAVDALKKEKNYGVAAIGQGDTDAFLRVAALLGNPVLEELQPVTEVAAPPATGGSPNIVDDDRPTD
jgi:hypothetical protein